MALKRKLAICPRVGRVCPKCVIRRHVAVGCSGWIADVRQPRAERLARADSSHSGGKAAPYPAPNGMHPALTGAIFTAQGAL